MSASASSPSAAASSTHAESLSASSSSSISAAPSPVSSADECLHVLHSRMESALRSGSDEDSNIRAAFNEARDAIESIQENAISSDRMYHLHASMLTFVRVRVQEAEKNPESAVRLEKLRAEQQRHQQQMGRFKQLEVQMEEPCGLETPNADPAGDAMRADSSARDPLLPPSNSSSSSSFHKPWLYVARSGSQTSVSSIPRDLEESLQLLEKELADPLQLIRATVQGSFATPPLRNFSELELQIQLQESFQQSIDELRLRMVPESTGAQATASASSGPQPAPVPPTDRLRQTIDRVCTEVMEQLYARQIEFFRLALVTVKASECLFDAHTGSIHLVKKRFRRLAFLFHPDRTQRCGIREEDFALRKELWEVAQKFCAHYEQALSKNAAAGGGGDTKYHLERAAQFHQLGLAMHSGRDAAASQLRREHFTLAIAEYRECCRAFDQCDPPDVLDQVGIRLELSQCMLDFRAHGVEAHLYALGAMQLILRHSNNKKVTPALLKRVTEMLNKVRRTSSDEAKQAEKAAAGSGAGASSSSSSSAPRASQSLVVQQHSLDVAVRRMDEERDTVSEALTVVDLRGLKQDVDSELTRLCQQKLSIRSNAAVVRYQTAASEILSAHNNAKNQRLHGAVTMTGGAVAGAGVGVVAVMDVVGTVSAASAAGTGVASAALLGPFAAIAGGVLLLTCGLYFGYRLIKHGHEMTKEPAIREALNKRMVTALALFNNGQYQAFIDLLGVKYYHDEPPLLLTAGGPGKVDLNVRFKLNSDDLISTLLLHKFRPDGIAYLLNLLGEAFVSGEVRMPNLTTADLRQCGVDAFTGSLAQKLMDESNELDNIVRRLRVESVTPGSRLWRSWMARESTSIAAEHLGDSREMPFRDRLEEMRNVARLNLAILRVMESDAEAIALARSLVDEVRASIKTSYGFISQARDRLEVLEDFLWIVTGQPPAEPEMQMSETPEQKPEQSLDLLSFYDGQLKLCKSDKDRIQWINKKAQCYVHAAEAERDTLKRLAHWQQALAYFRASATMLSASSNAEALLGYARCLNHLTKPTQAFDWLANHTDALSKQPGWFTQIGIAQAKLHAYDKAQDSLVQAVAMAPHDDEANNALRVVKRRLKNGGRQTIERIKEKFREPVEMQSLESHYMRTRQMAAREEQPIYKIWSVDGGGIRGIIPAVLLAALEAETNRPMAHSFHLAAGTSTGAVIAAGLCMPDFEWRMDSNGCSYRDFSTWKPAYPAQRLVDLYASQASNIFQRHSGAWWNPLQRVTRAMYSSAGRKTVFQTFFPDVHINDALSDLYIPAVCENRANATHEFTKSSARLNGDHNVSFVDALMATSAAPTYFDQHTIAGLGAFLDGGVQLNNPAQRARTYAVQLGIPSENIHVLSLGTGACVPDAHNPDGERSLMFWAQNIHNFTMAAQENNVDLELAAVCGGRYRRCQAWLETPIRLDASDASSIEQLVEIGEELVEDLRTSNDNSWNHIVEMANFERQG